MHVLDLQEIWTRGMACVKRVSFAERLVMQGIISLLFASRHVSKVQKWLRSAQRQTLTLVLNVIVRGKRTSRLATKNALRVIHIYIERTKT